MTRVLVDADVHTLEGPRARAIAWEGERVVAVGDEGEVLRAAGANPEIAGARGATVLPGFVDPHHHACIGALYGGTTRLARPEVTDIGSLQRALAAASKELEPGRWLVATDWDELVLDERRAPTRAELDDAVPDRPLFALHYSCHRALANSRALELAKIDASTPDPSGGAIDRGRRGAPSGLLVERGMSRVETLARVDRRTHDAEGFFARLARHHARLVEAGITRVVDAAVPADLIAAVVEAARRGLLTVPMTLMPVSTTGWLEAPWDLFEGPLPTGFGDVVRIGPIKLIFDGAPTCAMCLAWWQLAGVAARASLLALGQRSFDTIRTLLSTRPAFGLRVRTGVRIFDRAEAHAVVRAAAEHGLGLATHAIGNEAVDVALAAYEATAARGPRRLEHATFLDRELCARIAGVGAAVVTQPVFLRLPAFASAPAVPRLSNTPVRWLLDAKVPVAASSDYPVAPFEPLLGIHAAMTRETETGRSLEPDQRVSLDEAIAMYTRTAARASGCLDVCGTLAPGKRADLVVLDRPLVDAESVSRARIVATVLGGKVACGALTPRA